MRNTNSFKTLLKESKIIWLREKKQANNNSASELGRELLSESNYRIIPTPSNFFLWPALFFQLLRETPTIYYQISKPTTNLFVLLLIFFRKSIAIHYLDNITGGYPKWAKTIQLDRIIYCLIKNASFSIFISQTMLRFYRRKLKPHGQLSISYRVNPDNEYAEDNIFLKHDNCLVYLGAINPKTNLHAILEVSSILETNGMELHIYTRTNKNIILNKLNRKNIKIFNEIPASEVVSVTADYEAILFPFNLDKQSQQFYRMSVPSKLPNTIMARRPIVFYGPKGFWLYSWLKKYPQYFYEIESFISNKNRNKELINKEEAVDLYESFVNSEL